MNDIEYGKATYKPLFLVSSAKADLNGEELFTLSDRCVPGADQFLVYELILEENT